MLSTRRNCCVPAALVIITRLPALNAVRLHYLQAGFVLNRDSYPKGTTVSTPTGVCPEPPSLLYCPSLCLLQDPAGLAMCRTAAVMAAAAALEAARQRALTQREKQAHLRYSNSTSHHSGHASNRSFLVNGQRTTFWNDCRLEGT